MLRRAFFPFRDGLDVLAKAGATAVIQPGGSVRDAEVIATHVGDRLRGAEQVGKYKGHPIVYAEGVGPIASPGAIWIGESARLTNAATGEGISYAMRSACVAAAAIGRHERSGTALLQDYQAQTTRTFALPLRTAVGFMNFVNTPVFGMASSLITSRAVQGTMRYLLANA